MFFSGFVDLTSGTNKDANNLSTAGVQAYVIGNESPYTVVAQVQGTAVSKSIYPGTVDYVDILPGFSGAIHFVVTAKLANAATWPSFFLQLDTVGSQEHFNRSAYPFALPRQVNIGGTVNTSSINALSNEGGPANVLVIDIGDAAFSQLLTIFSDGHSTWSVDQSGTKHQVLNIQTSGNPLQIGQAGDITECLGAFTIDQNGVVTGTLTVTGDATFNGALPSITALHGINFTTGNAAYLQSSGTEILGSIDASNKSIRINAPNSGGGGLISFQIGGVISASVDAAGSHVATGNAVFFSQGSFTNVSPFSGTGSGTFATGIASGTVFQIICDPCTVSGSSQTIGFTKANSSVVTTGAGLAWTATAYN